MLPASKALYQFLRDDGRIDSEPESGFEPADTDVDSPDIRQYMTVKMKKKRQQLMLKQMLTDSGYGDLAKMVSIGKESHDAGDDEID